MSSWEFHKSSSNGDIERISSEFDNSNGDSEFGTIPDEEFDKLYDNLLVVLNRHGRSSEKPSDKTADFRTSRYCEQSPTIGVVPHDKLSPLVALEAGLEAVRTSHRPLGIIFDFYPKTLFICSPNKVYTTFDQSDLESPTAH